MRRELRELQGNKEALAIYVEARNKLVSSGVFSALRAIGRPTRHDLGRDPNVMASEGNYSSGWNDCLDALLHFSETYLPDEDNAINNPEAPDFGALDLAVSRGDLTKEEADERKRQGTYGRPDATKYTSNIKPPTR